MAKKPSVPTIQSVKSKTGVTLTLKPFIAEKLSSLEITTQIAAVQSGRPPQAKTWFTGVSSATPLSTVDVIAWIEAMRAMQAETKVAIENWNP